MRRGLKYFANPEQRREGYGAARLNLLPVTRRKSERDHIFLRVAAPLSQVADSLAESEKEFMLIRHLRPCRVTRAKTPRAD